MKNIDIGKLVFACAIPLLHIPVAEFNQSLAAQYFARLGVPFFFAVSGLFLARSRNKNGARQSFQKFEVRVGTLLGIWMVIYAPLIYIQLRGKPHLIMRLIVLTPGYLWYLSAMLIAAIPFCFIKNRKALWGSALVLYAFGTFYSESYQWISGGRVTDIIEQTILSTRNGIFFALPMMCVGEMVLKSKRNRLRGSICMFAVTIISLFAEITYVGKCAAEHSDRSMYFLLPIATFALINLLMSIPQPNFDTTNIRHMSTAIYLMQFGIIRVLAILQEYAGLQISGGIYYLCILLIPTVFYSIINRNRLAQILF